MEKINKKAKKLADLLEKVTAIPLIIVGGVMFSIVIIGTFYRYVLNSPLLWAETAARYLMIWLALVAASISLKRREHIGVEFFVKKLKPGFRKIVKLITNLFILYFLYILLKEGWILALKSKSQTSFALNMSMFWPLLSVPVSAFFTIIQLILQMIVDITE